MLTAATSTSNLLLAFSTEGKVPAGASEKSIVGSGDQPSATFASILAAFATDQPTEVAPQAEIQDALQPIEEPDESTNELAALPFEPSRDLPVVDSLISRSLGFEGRQNPESLLPVDTGVLAIFSPEFQSKEFVGIRSVKPQIATENLDAETQSLAEKVLATADAEQVVSEASVVADSTPSEADVNEPSLEQKAVGGEQRVTQQQVAQQQEVADSSSTRDEERDQDFARSSAEDTNFIAETLSGIGAVPNALTEKGTLRSPVESSLSQNVVNGVETTFETLETVLPQRDSLVATQQRLATFGDFETVSGDQGGTVSSDSYANPGNSPVLSAPTSTPFSTTQLFGGHQVNDRTAIPSTLQRQASHVDEFTVPRSEVVDSVSAGTTKLPQLTAAETFQANLVAEQSAVGEQSNDVVNLAVGARNQIESRIGSGTVSAELNQAKQNSVESEASQATTVPVELSSGLPSVDLLNTDVSQIDLPKQIAESVLQQVDVSGEVDEALKIRLDPPQLGEITLEAHSRGDRTILRITAAEAVTQTVLQQSIAELKAAETTNSPIADFEFEFDFEEGSQRDQQETREEANRRWLVDQRILNSHNTSIDFVA